MLDKGVLPSSYKEAKLNVCPIHKKDDRSLVNNYRPIPILNAKVKVFERIIFKHLFNHLQENSCLTSIQSDFMPGDSTVNHLTFLYNIFCQVLDANKEIQVDFVTLVRPLIVSGMLVYYANLKLLASLGNFLIGSKTTYLTEDNV